jgi:hypothetical protein
MQTKSPSPYPDMQASVGPTSGIFLPPSFPLAHCLPGIMTSLLFFTQAGSHYRSLHLLFSCLEYSIPYPTQHISKSFPLLLSFRYLLNYNILSESSLPSSYKSETLLKFLGPPQLLLLLQCIQ